MKEEDAMTDDRELEGWRREWQQLGGKADFATAVAARAARDGKRMRRGAAAEVLGVVFSSSVSLWLVVRSRGALDLAVVAGIILLFNGGWLTHFFTVRGALFASSGEAASAFVALTRKRLAAERQWARFAKVWMTALGVALVPWGIWFFVAHQEGYRAAPWRAVVGFGGAAAIFAGGFLWMVRKEKRLGSEAERFERQVADVDIV